MRDAMGRAVPKRLDKIFNGRRALIRWSHEIEHIKDKFAEFESKAYARDIDFEAVRRHLQSARRLIVLGAPFEECDCPFEEKQCPKCKGQRWISGYHAPGLKESGLPPV